MFSLAFSWVFANFTLALIIEILLLKKCIVYTMLVILFICMLIINSCSQEFYFTRIENNFSINIKFKDRYVFNFKNHKLKFSRINFHRINFKQMQHVSRIILNFGKTWSRFLLQLYNVLSSAKLQTSGYVTEKKHLWIY